MNISILYFPTFSTFLQVLLAVYLVVVVLLVMRQIAQVEDEDEELVVIMTDQDGITDFRSVENVIRNKNEVHL